MTKVSDKKLLIIKDLPSYDNINLQISKVSRRDDRELQQKFPKWNESGHQNQLDYGMAKLLLIIKRWDLEGEDGNKLPINEENLGYLSDEDITEIYAKISGFTVDEMREMAKKKVLNSTS